MVRARSSGDAMYFQDLISSLQNHWAAQGCILQQAYDLEVGAGTMHPATFLRALGPEPWNVAYVQPSRRPADGRFGETPNRLFQHHQFQVLLKPAPKNVQELYLESIRAFGIDPLEHDIRFVEDDWEAPTLGAWGLGWEVWCDGMEITQFTYFQQCGGFECRPVSAELTYGLELPLPAYDYALKCSHAFNLLDARGAISVTERASFIKRVRDNARRCAEGYLRQRERLGYPLLKTRWTVGDQPPVLEGKPASDFWKTVSFAKREDK